MSLLITCGSLFLEGLLSFFSPCVLPLVPLYVAYLTQEARYEDEDGNTHYSRSKTMWMTLWFVLGICTVFVIAGLGVSALHLFFTKYTTMFQIIGGVILILFGLVSLHIIRIPFLEKTYQTGRKYTKMNALNAYLMGFFFSFAWSPCIGPLLANAMMQAAQAVTAVEGWIRIASYAFGFIVVFMILGFATEQVLSLLTKHRNVVKYTGVIAGIVVICMGGYMLLKAGASLKSTANTTAQETNSATDSTSAEEGVATIEKFDFTLKNGEGDDVTLSDFKGKKIVVDFFGTWCPYCLEELPFFEKISQEDENVKFLLIAAPGYNGEGTVEEVEKFMGENGYTMEVLYDTDLNVTRLYQVSGYPNSYIICPDGTFFGRIPGYVPEEQFLEYLKQAE